MKTDDLPFEELELSKKTTLGQLLNTAARLFGENPKKGRLLIEDTVISGAKLFMSLGDFGIAIGQLVYAEFCNSSNEFPSDLFKGNDKASPSKKNKEK